MKVLLITYDLKHPKNSYKSFFDVLKSAPKWWHYLESTWLIVSDESPKEWNDKLISNIYETDRIFIIEVKPNYYGWLTKDSWKWIEKNLG